MAMIVGVLPPFLHTATGRAWSIRTTQSCNDILREQQDWKWSISNHSFVQVLLFLALIYPFFCSPSRWWTASKMRSLKYLSLSALWLSHTIASPIVTSIGEEDDDIVLNIYGKYRIIINQLDETAACSKDNAPSPLLYACACHSTEVCPYW